MSTQVVSTNIAETFAPMSARRLQIFGGIALIAGGMLFGDIFAVFVLHQNGGQTGRAILAASEAVNARNALAVKEVFQQIGGLLEEHGTKVDTHVHMTDAGYLALLLALMQPYVVLSPRLKKLLAGLFLTGGLLLPVGIFLIHYVGLAYSPFAVIGWASVLADLAGAVLIYSLAGFGWGTWRYVRSRRVTSIEPEFSTDRSWERRVLLAGGTLLILAGFLYGAWYAEKHLYEHERMETGLLFAMLHTAAAKQTMAAEQAVT